MLGNAYDNGTRLFYMSHNNLTRVELTVFQLVLEKLAPYGGYLEAWVDIDNST
jgi:hypothetical protein